MVIDGKVYDMSRGSFLSAEHPGGVRMPLRYGGRDATEQWNAIHGHKKEQIMREIAPRLLVGVVVDAAASADAAAGAAAGADAGADAAAPTGFVFRTRPGEGLGGAAEGRGVPPPRTLLDPRTESSEVQSWHSGGTAGVLPAERARASFDTEVMTHIYDGGKVHTERRRFIASYHDGADLQVS